MTNRSGWLVFAAVVLVMTGVMRIFDSIWAFRYKGTLVDGLNQALFGHSLKTYGWLWLVVGIILILAGFFVLGSSDAATARVSRWVGIFAAVISALAAITWVPFYPVWSLIYVGIAIMVIYALAARFEEEPA